MPKRSFTISEIKNLDFIGRESYIQEFFQIFRSHAGSKKGIHHVIAYYGIGGIGKSKLQKKLISDLTSGSIINVVARVNFADLISTQGVDSILHYLRNKLSIADTNIRFNRFDYAYLILCLKINPIIKTTESGLLKNLHIDILTPGLLAFITNTVVSGAISTISVLLSKNDVKLKQWWDKYQYPELELIHTYEPVRLIEELPVLFAKDIQDYLHRNEFKHIIIFFDTYENLSYHTEKKPINLNNDKWLRNLIIDLPQVLWVISGREKLDWENLYPEEDWKDSIYSFCIQEFTDEEVDFLLDHYHIQDLDIRDKIKEASKNHPLYLNLSISTFNLISETRPPIPDDFGSTFQQIYESFIRHLTPIEREIFKVISCLRDWNNELLELLLKDLNIAYSLRSIHLIQTFSFVSESNGYFTLHQLLREHLYHQFNLEFPEIVRRVHKFTFEYLENQIKSTDEIDKKKVLILKGLHHAKFLFSPEHIYTWISDYTRILDKALHFEFYIEALTPISQLMLKEGIESEIIADCLDRLGDSFQISGLLDNAESFYKEALSIRIRIYGENHPRTAISYSYLATLYKTQERFNEADVLLRKSIEIFEQIFGESHRDTAAMYNNFAGLLEKKGELEEAEIYYRKSLAVCLKVYGGEDPDSATCYNNLAGIMFSMGKFSDAETFYSKSLLIREKVLGINHPETASTLDNLAGLFKEQEKFSKALEFYQKSIRICEEIYGENHPKTAISYNNLGDMYSRQGLYDKAEHFLKKSIEIFKFFYGEDHSAFATSVNNLASCFEKQGKHIESETMYRIVVKINMQNYGEEHIITAAAYNNLASSLSNQAKYGEAYEFYQKAMLIREMKFGLNHPNTAITYSNLASSFFKQGKYLHAEKLFRKALKIFQNKFGENHSRTATLYGNLASTLEKMGKSRKAERYYRKAIAVFEKRENKELANYYTSFAGLLENMGEIGEAESLYNKAFIIMYKLLGNHTDTTFIRLKLLSLQLRKKK